MITPVTAQLLPGAAKTAKGPQSSRTDKSQSPRPHTQRTDTAGLAASIMADGGLEFLRSRLEEKMSALFEKMADENPELAANGPAAFFDTSVDVTPEATADRIVSFALGLRGIFSRQNSELSHDEMMVRFEYEIRRGISEGFGHARGVLGDLELLEGSVQDNVATTWDLVQQKLEEFFRPAEDES
jgi:hypothetical protein